MQLIPNTFSAYKLTEDDTTEGAIFTPLQTAVLQNLLAVKAEEKLALEFDVTKPESFIQQEAYHKGQVELLQYLLDNSRSLIEIKNNPHLNPNNQ